MDKSWISNNSVTKEKYIRGVLNFLDFAFAKPSDDGKFFCPCTKCVNYKRRSRVDAYDHIINHGFLKGYTNWIFHGEQVGSSSSLGTSQIEREFDHDMDTLVHDAFAMHTTNESDDTYINMEDGDPEAFINENNVQSEEGNSQDKFYQLLKEAERSLYPGCKKFTKLSFIVHLYHLKCLNGWTDKSFSMLLELLRDVLPEENTLPKSFYDTKKIISGLGLTYEKIHVCPSDCILYWRELSNVDICPKCGLSRWKLNSDDIESKKKIPAKILRWFPLKPRLQRLFLSSKTASSMTWHEDGRTKDGLMRHPADSFAWKDFDRQYPDFSCDPRNVRLGLASDGFNPFKTMSISHSTWPVILIPYNLPPWMCMKQPNFILSLLVPGPKGPGNKLDVYMQPLMEELKELWEIGLKTFDASKNESFQMRVAILWTINDFPAYANLSGWSTKGQYACPCCGFETASKWLRYSRKFCYMCHRRWLEPNHKWRYNKGDFDGTQEFRAPPELTNGTFVLRQLEDYGVGSWSPLNKKSILFTLPYWQHNVLRHNLDVMHIEKNVCDNIIGTLLHLDGKTKDNDKARYDLVDMNIRRQLHPKMHRSKGKKYLPRACYQMTSNEKETFLEVLKMIKAPDEFLSNISRCVQVKQRKIFGLKSYDCHLLMQQYLPIAMKGCLPDKDELKKHMVEAESSQNPQTTQDFTNWKNDIYSKVKGPEKRGRVRCLGKLPRPACSNVSFESSNGDNRIQKLENLLGSLVAVLQTRFSEDPQINAVLQAVAQEIPDIPSASNDSIGNNNQTTRDAN